MDISANSYNQPVSFYNKNMSNNIGLLHEMNTTEIMGGNTAVSEKNRIEAEKNTFGIHKRKRKNKRLNTYDFDYLPDEVDEEEAVHKEPENIFIKKQENQIINRLTKSIKYFMENTPLINYFFLKKTKIKIQKTVEQLNNINQNVDEMMNTSMPYGENQQIYDKITQNLTAAVEIIGKANKELIRKN